MLRLVSFVAALLALGHVAPQPLDVGVSGTDLTVDGRGTFLTGISLFDALGSAAPRDADLDALAGWGARVVRVWAHWSEPITAPDGALTPAGRARLLALVRRLQARGLVLELVLLRPGELPGEPYAAFASGAARERAVSEMTTALLEFRNVIFDLCNEHDHPDGPMSHADARRLRDRVREVDPRRIVTISSTEYHLIGADGRLSPDQARNLREEATAGPGAVGVDVVAPHLPRTDDWASASLDRVAAIRRALEAIGRPLPVYLNEEKRAEEDSAIPVNEYLSAAAGARRAGAAGWLLHTAAGFELDRVPLLGALTRAEREALSQLARRSR